jgi:hypothetical protein
MKRAIALLLSAALVASGCATSRGPRVQTAPQAPTTAKDRAVLADFARSLPSGSRVRARVVGNDTVKGTLLKVSDDAIVIQPRARVAESPLEIPFSTLVSLEPETPTGGVGRAVAIGALAGAGAALGTILLLALVFAGD